MIRLVGIVFSFVFILLFSSSLIFASTLSLSSQMTSLNNLDEEYLANITLSINASDDTVYYLRGVFHKQGSSNYCGYTWNGTSWFSGPYTTNEGWKDFLSITIKDSSWSGELKAKIDPQDSGCQDTGAYFFKVQRFTQNSSSGTFDPQDELSININIPSPTPSPVSSPTATPLPVTTTSLTSTPKPSATSHQLSSPTPTPKPTASPLKSLTPSSTASYSGQLLSTAASTVAAILSVESATVAGTTSSLLTTSFDKPINSNSPGQNIILKSLLILVILASIGMVLSAFWIHKRKQGII
ncbi:MAG: hypothetical protein V1858_03695 [Candidatus Gottesmanbacteria bacterium]